MSLLLAGGRGGDAEEDQDGAIEADNIFVSETSHERADLGLGDGGDLVHHEAGRGAESMGRMQKAETK